MESIGLEFQLYLQTDIRIKTDTFAVDSDKNLDSNC